MNSKRNEMQRRARRLIETTGSPRDLDLLLLWLRDKSYGNHAIRDLGDFVGHPDRRSSGPASGRVRNFHDQVAYHIQRLALPEGKQRALDPQQSLAQLRTAASGSLANSSDHEIYDWTGYSRKSAKNTLERVLDASHFTDGRTISAPPMSEKELRLFDKFAQTLVVRPAFQERSLAEEFADCLKRNVLVSPDLQTDDTFDSRISAYAISKLHHVEIELGDGKMSRLEARYDPYSKDWLLNVDAHINPIDCDAAPVPVCFPILETKLDARAWCEQELLLTSDWQFPVELGENWKLRMV